MTYVTHKFLSMYLFLLLTLYIFRTHCAHHQERKIVSIQPLVTVTLCWWPTCKQHGHQHRVTVTRVCIDTIVLLFYVCIAVLTLDAELLASSQYPKGPATDHLDTGFSWFPGVYKRMLR